MRVQCHETRWNVSVTPTMLLIARVEKSWQTIWWSGNANGDRDFFLGDHDSAIPQNHRNACGAAVNISDLCDNGRVLTLVEYDPLPARSGQLPHRFLHSNQTL